MEPNDEEDTEERTVEEHFRLMLDKVSPGDWSFTKAPAGETRKLIMAFLDQSEERKTSKDWHFIIVKHEGEEKIVGCTFGGKNSYHNARFIVHARNWMHFLLEFLSSPSMSFLSSMTRNIGNIGLAVMEAIENVKNR